MKIISLARKLLWCLDFICRMLKTIFRGHEDRWSKKLPDDVLQLILQRLLMSDYFSCRDVCRSWRAAIDSKRCLPSDQLPWLLLNSGHSFYIKDDCFVSDRKICKPKKNLTEYWRRCVGSIEGWLIMTTAHKFVEVRFFFFLNPVSGARVMLPSLSEPENFRILKAVAASVPTKTRSCYVSCLHHFEKEVRLAFCMPGDKSWTLVEAKAAKDDHEKALEFRDIEIVDGKLYALTSHALKFLMVFDIQLDTNGHGIHTYTAERLVTLHLNIGRAVEDSAYFRNCYLAKGSESKDELFMILRKTSWGKTRGFLVLKLKYNITTGPQWVEIVDLGDHVLFTGRRNNKFIPSGSTSHDQTLERNSIYFVFNWPHRAYECGVFSLTNRSIKPLTFPEYHSRTSVNNSLWFTPNPW